MARRLLSPFLRAQLIGWTAWIVLRFAMVYAQRDLSMWMICESAVGTVIKGASGFLVSFGLGAIYERVMRRRLSVGATFAVAIPASLVAGVLWELGYQYGYWLYDPSEPIVYIAKEMLNLGVTMIGWSGLYVGFSWRRELEAEKERALRADALATEARLEMLRYQINPHFLFNALNAVRALIDENPTGARRMVTQLAEFFRFSLVHGEDREASLADELEAIRNYLAIQKTRFDDHLEVAIEVDPSVGDVRLPAFLIHPLVENAVKYGMETSPMPLRIRLAASLSEGRLTVEVANTGRWLDPDRLREGSAEGTGTGLHNIRGRLAMLLPGRHRFDIREQDGWVRAVLDLSPAPAR